MKYIFIVFLTIITLSSAIAQAKGGGSLQAAQPKKVKINGILALPSIISHQGYIADSTGVGLNGVFPMTFGFFADSTGGSAILSQSLSAVTITKGVFSVNLDVSSISFTSQYWLETSINGQTLAPRTELTSAPYSLYSLTADTASYARAGTHYIGESYGGGIVFYVDSSGQHGLIAATADQSPGIWWYNGTFTTTNAIRDGIGAGMYNTQLIIANEGPGWDAGQICANYQGGGYGDWYLPSKYELNLSFQQQGVVGGFVPDTYWSSTEDSSDVAWAQTFNNGVQYFTNKSEMEHVRAIRAF
jgi:hypothetical protein